MDVNCPGAPFGFSMPSRLRLETGVAWRFIGLVLAARAYRRSTRGRIAPWFHDEDQWDTFNKNGGFSWV